jgi:hypothetical protein
LIRLVSQINADSADERKAATGRLLREYKSSAAAIAQVIGLYSAERLPALSPSGVINGFYYLAGTDPEAWTTDSVQRGTGGGGGGRGKGPRSADEGEHGSPHQVSRDVEQDTPLRGPAA